MDLAQEETDRSAWTRPGTFEVAEGVHRIPLPLPGDALRAVNVYAVEDGDGIALVDAGWALEEAQQALDRALGELGHDLGSVRRCLVTHVHRDHYTMALTLRRLFGARVSLGCDERDTLESIAGPDRRHFSAGLLGRITAAGAAALVTRLVELEEGMEPLDPDQWTLPDEWLQDERVLQVGERRLRVLATPGHTRGHVVFHDEDNALLFAGDHVLSQITPSIGFESVPGPSPLQDYLESLARVAALRDSVLLPAHGPVRPSTAARVLQLQEHHDARLSQMADVLARGPATALDVAQAVRWTRRGYDFTDLDLFNQMIAINETLAHLDVLVEQGRAVARPDAGAREFTAVSGDLTTASRGPSAASDGT